MIRIELEKNERKGGQMGYFFEDTIFQDVIDGELVWGKKLKKYNGAFELQEGLELTEEEYCDMVLNKEVVVSIKVDENGKQRLYYVKKHKDDEELKDGEFAVRLTSARVGTYEDKLTKINKGYIRFGFELLNEPTNELEALDDLSSELPF